MTSEEFLDHTKNIQDLKIYTDGACSGNPGPGGWGAVFVAQSKEIHAISGFDIATTNNRMEMMAAIQAMQAIPPQTKVVLYTDSAYLQNGITSWIHGWKKKGWKTAKGSPIKNQDLWHMLDDLSNQLEITWEWVKAHNGNTYNERADALARQAVITAHMNKK